MGALIELPPRGLAGPPGGGRLVSDPRFDVRMVRSEILTTGIDEVFQTVGSDPSGRNAGLGLRIPGLPSDRLFAAGNATPATQRYLFLLCTFQVGHGAIARLRGLRQLVTLGARTYRPVEQAICEPWWHPPGGSISWHLRDLGPAGVEGIPGWNPPMQYPAGMPLGLDNLAYRMSGSPALLAESATVPDPYYVDLTAYVPPNGGMPYGVSLLPGYDTLYDLRHTWRDDRAWDSLDVPIVGPKTIALFASVRQPDSDAEGYALPSGSYSCEENFLTKFPTAVYWRIAGSLLVES